MSVKDQISMFDESSWIYLIFFMIPLARILPRLVRKWQKRNTTENHFNPTEPKTNQTQESFQRPQNKETQVLGEINRGVKYFNTIQRNLNMDNQELENILKNLEERGLMKVVRKQGIFGIKVELHPTERL